MFGRLDTLLKIERDFTPAATISDVIDSLAFTDHGVYLKYEQGRKQVTKEETISLKQRQLH
jgi:hypothetical protein